jgi:hypothetical protein
MHFNPENKMLEGEEIKIKETAEGLVSMLQEKFMAISAKLESLLREIKDITIWR